MPDTTNYNALAGAPLFKGFANQTLGAGATIVQDASVTGSDWLTVTGSLGPTAAAAGDLTCSVFPYASDGLTILGTPLPPAAGFGYAGTLSASKSELSQKYDVSGYDMVRVVWKNNNAGALPLKAGWEEESW